MVYLTGDTHGNFSRAAAFCYEAETTEKDILIILGDAGINYFGEAGDRGLKLFLAGLPITLFCIHGNHERRPEASGCGEIEWRGGKAFSEPDFPRLLFAKDGEIYNFAGKRCIAIGGAYSVDKHIRLALGYGWWPDEQPSAEIKKLVERRLQAENWRVDIVLSHTCPLKYEPGEMFIGGVSESEVDKSTERWLDGIEDRLRYKRWYCGHYHTDKTVYRLRFMFNDFIELNYYFGGLIL